MTRLPMSIMSQAKIYMNNNFDIVRVRNKGWYGHQVRIFKAVFCPSIFFKKLVLITKVQNQNNNFQNTILSTR